ncbi:MULTISPECIES: leucine-rich repeat protein [Gordonibacter]|uniref:Leucine-rich repeat protein n=1 Tax=Gordonibacter faecis TaxID=3047475 RepID=A0ABT7DNW1_9ACTN|nr:leucine-rich repeat protein [Gordonibacter sp. KGMB12511]MDJ1651235.1 leucine-rich repeat protein [Gordonibacter sp. KGMB12511]
MSGQVAGTVVLPSDAGAVSIVGDGLVFEIDDTSKTATLVGSAATPPKGDLSVPASVTSGTTTYEVTAIAKNVFAKCSELTSVSLPATLREVDPDALMGCTSLKSITVSAKNAAFTSHDGMLFTKDYTRLLLIPEGMEGAANIPGSTTTVPAQALSRCYLMGSSLTAGDGSAAFITQGGMLFTKDLKALVSCPPAIGNAVVLPAETETIGEYALAGCKDLTAITTLGNVREINPTAFTEEVKASAVVALPAGESKAIWEQAGFQHFAEPAEPGATTRPEADAEAASGLVFTLLNDYTLTVTWEGAEDPAADLEIPASAEINGVSYRVSTIAANAFANRGTLKSVTLPATVTSISEAAFAGCANLADIQLLANLHEVGERAFEATSLTDIWLPASVQSIGSRAFASCESLTRIVALGTPQVADDALAGCANLSVYCPSLSSRPSEASGEIPSGDSQLAFYSWNLGLLANNNHLLPYGLTLPEEPLSLEVGQQANLFEGGTCEAPSPVELSFSYAAKPLSVDEQGTTTAKAEGTSEVTATLTLEGHELARATRTVEVTVPASENPAGEQASTPSETSNIVSTELLEQSTNQSLASTTEVAVTPQMLTGTMNLSATSSNPLLGTTFEQQTPAPAQATNDITPLAATDYFEQGKDGTWLKYTVTKADEGTGSYEVSVGASTVIAKRPAGAIVVPRQVINNGIDYTVTSVTASGFNACRDLLRIELPETIKIIETRAFNQTGLSETPIMPGVTQLKSSVFRDCDNLQELVIPNSVEYIGELCFEMCDNLRRVTFPSSLKGEAAGKPYLNAPFVACPSLETIELGENLPYKLIDGALYSADGKSLVDLGTVRSTIFEVPSGVETIKRSAIKDRPGIQGLVIPSSIKLLDRNAFRVFHGSEILCLPPASDIQLDSSVLTTPDGDVSVYCSDPTLWQGNEGTIIKHDVGLPASFSVLNDGGAATLSTNLSIPVGSQFASNIEVRWTFSEGADALATRTPSTSDAGRTLTIAGKAGASGSFTATASMVYTGPSSDPAGTVLATSETTVTVAPSHGALPSFAEGADPSTATSVESQASWKLENGVLTITCTPGRVIKDLGWCSTDGNEKWNGYWGDVRPLVTKVVMSEGLKAESMAQWFGRMGNLEDVSGMYIPEGVASANRLFDTCPKITSLPAGLTLPASVTDAANMFNGCTELTSLPTGFTIPTNSRLTVMQGMFANCPKLESLPVGLSIPKTVTNASSLCAGCTSLESLPDAFAIPKEATSINIQAMFSDCPRLMTLPKNFTMPETATADNMFRVTSTSPLPLYYAGVDTALTGKGTAWWTAQNRSFVTPSTAGQVQFQVPSTTAADQWETVTAFVPNAKTGLMPEPAAPVRAGHVFTLWYTDQNCTQRYDFGKSLADNGVEAAADGTYQLYGRYAAAATGNTATSSGILPTVDNQGTAWWSIGKDGDKTTLYLRGTGKVADFGWYITDEVWDLESNPRWYPYRTTITAIAMQPSLDAEVCDFWFRNMVKLTDASQVHIPKSATGLFGMFENTQLLTSLPEDLTLAEGAKNAAYLFSGSGLTSLPSSFKLPSTLKSARCLLKNTQIQNVPDGFLLPQGIENARYLFQGSSLVSLPAGFTIPSGGVDATGMFYGCSQLTALPEGFSVPDDIDASDSMLGMNGLFFGCNKLTYFPESFNFPANLAADAVLGGQSGDKGKYHPFYVDPATTTTPLPTYYSGTNEAVLAFDWASQNRVLITDPAGRGHKVTYKLANDDGTWKTYATVLTDAAGTVPRLAELQSESGFTGWSSDPDCLEPFNFAIPATSDVTVYGKRITHGGKYKSEGEEGYLPVENGQGTAWWYITNDKTLYVGCEGGASIGDLGWDIYNDRVDVDAYWSVGFWGPYRQDITCIVMESDVLATDMQSWFGNMRNLVTADFIIPENTVSLCSLFDFCDNLKNLPNDLVIPTSGKLDSFFRTFRFCYSLEKQPDTFFIPSSATNLGAMLEGTALSLLPEGFRLLTPDTVVDASWLFKDCKNLKTLPDGFVLPEGTEACRYMFHGCTLLTALPTGFSIPSTVTEATRMFCGCSALTTLPEGFGFDLDETGKRANIVVSRMFYDCPSLVSLPASLKLDLFSATASGESVVAEGLSTMFAFTTYTAEAPLDTYYSDDVNALIPQGYTKDNYWKTLMHRNLLSTTSLPADRPQVKLLLPDEVTGTYDMNNPYLVPIANAGGMLAPHEAPYRIDRVFLGWYTDPTCTKLFDFTKSLVENGVTTEPYALYGSYATASGPLPTESNATNADPAVAGWRLTTDGTLSIWCAPGETIASLWTSTDNDVWLFNYWGPVRSSVKRVVMDENIKTTSLMAWFCEMPQLVDAEGIFIPEGTKDLWRMFHNCSALATLPSDFAIPDGAENLRSMFRHCASLKQLPSDFTLPTSVNSVYAMLEFSGIESLPAGFAIPEAVTDVGWMLSNCLSLKSLPESFKIPENATEAPGLFYACSSLASLPSSFKIPGSMQNAASMFEHCRSLSSLPEGFKFENPSVLTNVSHLFKDCYSLTSLPSSFVLTGLEDKVDPAKPIFTTNNFTASTPLTTYYAGDDLTSLSVVAGSDAAATSEYWLQKHHRKLVSKNDSLPEGFKKVSFKTRVVSADEVASPILNWDDFTTIVTDATGTFRAPAAPVPYGYGFDGWYKDPECTIRFIFDADGSASVSADTVLYGKLVMRISFDAPTSAVMVLDASGAIQPALAQVKSYSAVPLAVSTISCTKMGAAEQLIDAVSLDKTKIVVRDATDPDTSTSLTFGTEKPTGFTLPASTSASAPGTLNLFIQMNAPPEATYTYVGDGLITDLARLTFQVRPM